VYRTYILPSYLTETLLMTKQLMLELMHLILSTVFEDEFVCLMYWYISSPEVG